MNKEQIKGILLKWQGDIAYGYEANDDDNLSILGVVANEILALSPQGDKIDGNALPSAAYDEYFTPPQGEGGLLSDEEICKTACGEYAGKCPARNLNHGFSFVDIMAVITKQHALDQQHEANALKEQDIFNRSWKQHSIEVEEEAIELFNAIREGSYKPDSYTTQPLEINVKALKAELESE